MSRARAIRYCRHQHKEPAVIISISSTDTDYKSAPYTSDKNNVQAVLSLWFDDITKPTRDKVLMSSTDALAVKLFVEKYAEMRIIVHCDMGVSRSAGVAAALLNVKGINCKYIFNSIFYHPNMHCYRTTLEGLLC